MHDFAPVRAFPIAVLMGTALAAFNAGPARIVAMAQAMAQDPAQARARGTLQPSSARPVLQPTVMLPQSTLSAPDASRGVRQTHRGAVTYRDGLLTVNANNASLNQILREIANLISMRITGGVADEHVFGNYGPSAPSRVLAALLDGTSSNMLLIQSVGGGIGSGVPSELVLTPRQGGPTPPNPEASLNSGTHSEDSPLNSPPLSPPEPQIRDPRQPYPRVNDAVRSTDYIAPGPAINATTPATTQEQSPNDIKTPQQIYEQLLRLRQQQSVQPAAK